MWLFKISIEGMIYCSHLGGSSHLLGKQEAFDDEEDEDEEVYSRSNLSNNSSPTSTTNHSLTNQHTKEQLMQVLTSKLIYLSRTCGIFVFTNPSPLDLVGWFFWTPHCGDLEVILT